MKDYQNKTGSKTVLRPGLRHDLGTKTEDKTGRLHGQEQTGHEKGTNVRKQEPGLNSDATKKQSTNLNPKK